MGGGMIENRGHLVKSNGSATNACTLSFQNAIGLARFVADKRVMLPRSLLGAYEWLRTNIRSH